MTIGRFRYNFKRSHLESWFWLIAIVMLAFSNPVEEGHASLCIVKNLNIGFCPGCGLGHSIAWLFRGEIIKSFNAHPLGIPAVIILLFRSFSLLKNDITIKKSIKHKIIEENIKE